MPRIARIARRLLCAAALALGALPASLPAAAAEQSRARQVLFLHSFGHDFSPFTEFAAQLRTELARASPSALDIYDVSLLAARHDAVPADGPFIAYLLNLFAERPPDLVVPIGGPAVRFAQRNRGRLFPDRPMLYAAVDARHIDYARLTTGEAVVAVAFDFAAVVGNILEVLPESTRLAIVLGNSPLERFWADELRRDLRPFEGRLELEMWNSLPYHEMLARAAALPPGSTILFGQLAVDAAGVPHTLSRTLAEIAKVASAPSFGLFDFQLGSGIVGGTLLSTRGLAADAASAALRVLQGAPADTIRTPARGPDAPQYDWRALQRWGIDEDRLPAGSHVLFREPTLWAQYRWIITSTIAIVVMQGVLITALLLQRRRRRRAEGQALALSGRLITAHEDERRRLGRELHDDVTQRLARLAIDAARIEREGRDRASAGAARAMREELARLSDDVHALSYRLHPSVIEDLGLVEALRAECDSLARHSPISVVVDAPELGTRPPRETAVCLYRVAQESLRNVVRHARASAVSVSLAARDGGLALTVEDNGAGYIGDGRGGRTSLGHASMRERVRLLGGRFDIRSAPGRGTTVSAWVPLTGAGA